MGTLMTENVPCLRKTVPLIPRKLTSVECPTAKSKIRKCSPQCIYMRPTVQLLAVRDHQQLCGGRIDLAVFSPSLMVLFSKTEPNCPLQGAFHLLGAEDKTIPPCYIQSLASHLLMTRLMPL